MNRIKEVLARKGLKVKWLAKQLNCHPTEISNWINGNRNPNLKRAMMMANILECTIEYLFPLTEKSKKEEGDLNVNIIEETSSEELSYGKDH